MVVPQRHSRDAVDEIFGDPSRQQPKDDGDSSLPDDDMEHDRWLRENTPPHHQ
jgi:hypothetical protein